MAGYWRRSFFASSSTTTFSRSINTQKKNLANIQPSWPHNWSITHMSYLSFSESRSSLRRPLVSPVHLQSQTLLQSISRLCLAVHSVMYYCLNSLAPSHDRTIRPTLPPPKKPLNIPEWGGVLGSVASRTQHTAPVKPSASENSPWREPNTHPEGSPTLTLTVTQHSPSPEHNTYSDGRTILYNHPDGHPDSHPDGRTILTLMGAQHTQTATEH